MESWDIRLLTATYRREEEGEGIIIELYGKTRELKSIVVRTKGFLPYFYFLEAEKADQSSQQALEGVLARLRSNPDVVSVEQQELFYNGKLRAAHKVTIKFPWKVPEFRDEIGRKFEVMAADIPFHHRYIYDNDLSSCIRAYGERRDVRYTTDLVVDLDHFEEIAPFTPQLKVLSFDIENSITDETIFTICYVIRDENGIRSGDPIYGTEREIIQAFTRAIQKEDPDVITGYNIDGYDIPFLRDRAKKLGLRELQWGRDLSEPRRVMNKFWRLTGRLIADAWWAVKMEIRPKQESLNAVSKLLLGEEKDAIGAEMKNAMKVTADGYDPRYIDKQWTESKETVMAYCLRDAELALRILEIVGRIRKYMDIATVSRLPVDDALNAGSSQLIDSILIRAADRHVPKVAVPLTGDFDTDEEAIEGGYVHEISPGLYHWVCVLDFKSMYPSLIIAKNICFTTRDPLGTIVSPVGVHFMSKEQRPGILPTILANLMKERDDTKKRMKAAKTPEEAHYYDGLQQAIKILMNSFYGVFASSFYRFTDRSIGSSITAFARETTKGIIQSLESEGHHVIYSDTDSVFVQSPATDLDGSRRFGQDLADRFSREGGSLEFEKIMEPLFSHGKKKRYVGRMVWPKEELVVRGYEMRRTDSFDLQSETLLAVFEKVLDDNPEEAVKAARRAVQDILAGKVPVEKLVISKGCKAFNQYANPDSQATVQAAKKLMAMGFEFVPGMKVSWIVINSRRSPQEIEPYVEGMPFTRTPDWKYYAERVAQTVSRVTEVYGLDEKSLLTGVSQQNLFQMTSPDDEKPTQTIKTDNVKKTNKKQTLDDFL